MKTEQIHYNKFRIHHFKHPYVWIMFHAKAQQAIDAGVKTWGAGGIFEVIRWQTDVTKELEYTSIINQSGDIIKYKLSNDHRAYYARLYNAAFNCTFFKVHKLDEPEPEYITEVLLPTQPGHPYYIG